MCDETKKEYIVLTADEHAAWDRSKKKAKENRDSYKRDVAFKLMQFANKNKTKVPRLYAATKKILKDKKDLGLGGKSIKKHLTGDDFTRLVGGYKGDDNGVLNITHGDDVKKALDYDKYAEEKSADDYIEFVRKLSLIHI